MKNGMKIIRKTDAGIQSIFFDQERTEFAAQNSKVQSRIDSVTAGKLRAVKRADKKQRAMDRLVRQCAALVGAMAALAVLSWLGLIHYGLAVTVMCLCLVILGIKVGRWLEWR